MKFANSVGFILEEDSDWIILAEDVIEQTTSFCRYQFEVSPTLEYCEHTRFHQTIHLFNIQVQCCYYDEVSGMFVIGVTFETERHDGVGRGSWDSRKSRDLLR